MSFLRLRKISYHPKESFGNRLGAFCYTAIVLHPALLATLRGRWLQRGGEKVCRLWHETWVTALLKCCALSAFVGYAFWNGFWLVHGRLPLSIWTALTGLPCPSSGMTRSLHALLIGNYANCILYNPFTIPFLLLLGYSVYRLLIAWKSKSDLLLPPFLSCLWLISIAAAWILKFLIGRAYW